MNQPEIQNRASTASEVALVWLLRADGVLLLTALVPAVMPFSWMQEIHRQLGLGELPSGPIVGYLTRSLSALYAVHGALVLFVSLDVRRFLPVVRCIAVLGIVFGVGMIFLDAAVSLPLYWIVCEGPLIAVLGTVVLWLTGKVSEDSGIAPPSAPTSAGDTISP